MTTLLPQEPCQLLAWDTDFFGFKIARVITHRLTPEKYSLIEAWCHDQQIRCLYFLADVDDNETIQVAETNGFNFVDIRLTFARTMHDWLAKPNNTLVRSCREGDLPKLAAIARIGHTDTRFFFDHRFPHDKAQLLYQIWLEKSFQNPKAAVIVGHDNEQAHSYITCIIETNGHGSIGLVGVDASNQGQGIGYTLVQAALNWFAEQQVTEVEVVTQGRNIRAQRLYQRNGFITQSVQLWYHRWFI